MDKKRTTKEKKIMGKLIKFPAHRVVYNQEPKRPELSEDEARQIKEDKFVEQITESLILDIIHVLQENVVDTKTDVFLRDLAIVIESIKGLLKRDFGRKHPMQTISDSIAKIHTLKDGRKVTDINYSKIIAKKQKENKKDTEERQQELDIQFDPDIKLD
tara:strand:- start:585 stop:1061 length:477 start_codon:yes stop_codon:yes gene_type:complete